MPVPDERARPADEPDRRRDPAAITAALDEVVEELGDDPDLWQREAARRALERCEWRDQPA